MLRRLSSMPILICLFLLTSGCAINRATAIVTPSTDFSKVKSFYIVEEQGDNNVCKLIEANLKKRGYDVSTGASIKSPYKSDVTLTYVDKWMWDITMYMLQLEVIFKDSTSNFIIARGHSHHTSLTRKSPEEMVDEVLTNIFKTKPIGKEERYD